ncbi:MAG: hypothetical protein JXA33_11935 [Anaerolineae bacterium]|nr:hypothetical protein [Anaerolineae bacterium]
MIEHLFLPQIDLTALELKSAHRAWLQEWLQSIERDLEDGNIASSLCLQGMMVEIVLYGELHYDWRALFAAYLTNEEGNPLAYSERYGKRLYRFGAQWKQTPVYAVHTRFWANRVYDPAAPVDLHYVQLLESWIQPSGWIYNRDVSYIRLRTRMKSEYTMSFAMGMEILAATGALAAHTPRFTATASNEPFMPYLSAEYFRLRALEQLDKAHLVPNGIPDVLEICAAGKGYCDFAVSNKVDDYIGSAKRIERDEAVHSPLAVLHAAYLARVCDTATQEAVKSRLADFRQHLQDHPLDIPAFRIRDIALLFGTDISPLEVITAAAIVQGLAEGELQ